MYINILLTYLVIVILLWKLVWSIIYKLFGISIGSITVNNGISFNHVKFHYHHKVNIDSIRFRLWGNNRKLIISELHIDINHHKYNNNNLSTDKKQRQEDFSLRVFPNNTIGKVLVKFLICNIPNLDIQFKRTTINIKQTVLNLEYFRITSDSRYSKQNAMNLKFKTVMILNFLKISNARASELEFPIMAMNSIKFDLKFIIELHNGLLNSIRCHLFTDDFKISIFKSIKLFLHDLKIKLEPEQQGTQRENSEQTLPEESKKSKDVEFSKEENIKQILGYFRLLYTNIDEISLFIENSQFLEVPILTNESTDKIFHQPYPHTSLECIIKSINLNLVKLSNNSAGFHSIFDKSDIPINFSHSIQSFIINYSTVTENNNLVSKSNLEVLNLPNYSVNSKGNIFDRLTKGEGFKDCKIELFLTVSNPIIDLDSNVLSLLIYNFVVIQKYFKYKKIYDIYRKLINHRIMPDDDDDDTNDINYIKKYPLKYRLWNYLQEKYPRLDVKFVIEQPRIILKHPTSKIQLINFQYNSLMLQIFTNNDRSYDLNCQILHPSINYIEQTTNFEIFKINNIVIRVGIFKNFKFKIDISVNNLKLDIGDLTAINGIQSSLSTLANACDQTLKSGPAIKYLDLQIEKYDRVVSRFLNNNKLKVSLLDRIFNYLPDWLIEFNFNLSFLNLKFGSTSILSSKVDDLRFFNVKLNKFETSFKNEVDSITSTKSSTSETLIDAQNEKLWGNSSEFNNLEFIVMTDFDNYETMLATPSIKIDLLCHQLLDINILINQLDGDIDYFKIFTTVGAISLMKKFVKPLQSMKYKFGSSNSTTNNYSNVVNNRKLNDLLNVEVKLKKTDIGLNLHNDYKLKLDLYQTRLNYLHQFSIYNKFGRLLTESPTLPNYWSRMLCLDDLKFSIGNNKEILFISDFIRIIHPHQHITYKLFDNLSISLKIFKHLFKLLKDPTLNDSQSIYPSEAKPKRLPNIKFKTKKFSFVMEDDPFESELNMIYQLGKTEQMKRIDHMIVYEQNAKKRKIPLADFNQGLAKLYESFSSSWIRKIKSYKDQLNNEIIKNKKFLFGNESKLESKYQKNVQPLSIHAPIISIFMNNVDLNISPPRFDLSDLPQFLYDIGQCQPLDTRWSLNIPTYMDLKLDELRMHLRDYPLPLLFVPSNTCKTPSVKMSGHLVIGESLVMGKEHIRELFCDLIKNDNGHGSNNISSDYSVRILKTLASVKLYTDLEVSFCSTSPSRFVWGQSYQFGIQQLMLNFDQFSKPPIDPSMKLGFWDKLRLVMHGRFRIECNKGPLEVAFKGSRDPYEVFNEGTGFILSFKDNVIWTINEDDDPRQFCNVKSENIIWYIPNYLASTLVSWCKDSNKVTYFPDCENLITSAYAYYLNDESYNNPNRINNTDIFEKKVVSLSGGVNFKVGFVLQRDNEIGEPVESGKYHHEIKLFNPKFTKNGHDSYKGFRSDYINMAISLDANFSKSYNTIHLSPQVFRQFFTWWKLFAGNTQLPIRKGKIFGEIKKSTKFSQHLISNRFKFNLTSLFISHVYREENLDNQDDFIQCWGLRGKMNDFIVDLHQRKEERISVNEHLSKNSKIKKMNFHIADVHLNGIDLRVVSAKFDNNIYHTVANNNPNIEFKHDNSKDSKYKVFDNDLKWFDIEDYEEAFLPSLNHCKRIVSILPLLYSERFSYLRDTEPDARFKSIDLFNNKVDPLEQSKKVFKTRRNVINNRIKQLKNQINKNGALNDLTKRIKILEDEINSLNDQELNYVDQERRLSTANVNAKFHNKFVLLHMLLKWNNSNRNLLNKYIHYVKLLGLLRRYLTYESISVVQDIIDRLDNWSEGDMDDKSLHSLPAQSISQFSSSYNADIGLKLHSSQDRLDNFDKILSHVASTEDLTQDYLFEIISPQIQLQSEESKDSVVLLTTPKIDGKVVSVFEKTNDKLTLGLEELQTRFGVLLSSTNVFVFNKDEDLDHVVFDEYCYGSTTNWPPWLGYEISKDSSLAGQGNVLIENISAMVTMVEQKPFATNLTRNGESGDNENNSKVIDDGKNNNNNNYNETDNETIYFDSSSEDNHRNSVSKSLRVDIPKVIITSTASQYFTLYSIITDLLIYTEPSNKEYLEKLEKLKFSNDLQDLPSIYDRIKSLHDYFRLIKFLNRNFNFRQNYLNNEQLNDYLSVQLILEQIKDEINLLMNSILSGNAGFDDSEGGSTKEQLRINADEIILHMLEDDRSPIIDIAMAKGKFERAVNVDDSNFNKVEVKMIQGFNLLPKASFPAFLEPLQEELKNNVILQEDNLITVVWSVHQDVGGIKLIDHFEVNSKPLSLRIDENTGTKLMNYIFQTDISNINESPLLDSEKSDKEEVEERMEIQGVEKNRYDKDETNVEGYDNFSVNNYHNDDLNVKFETSDKGSRISKKPSRLFGSGKSNTQSSTMEEDYDEQLNSMVSRSKKYISINHFIINPVALSVSLKLKGGYKRLLNVTDFHFLLPELRIQKRIMSVLEITMLLKKLITKAIFGHIGGLLKNKLTVSKRPMIFDTPLRPLKTYANFTSISELRKATTNQETSVIKKETL